MKYKKPTLNKVQSKMPPITTNFAPPPVENPNDPTGDEDIVWLEQALNKTMKDELEKKKLKTKDE